MSAMRVTTPAAALTALLCALTACGDRDDGAASRAARTDGGAAGAPSGAVIDRVVTAITDDPPAEVIEGATHPSERRALRRNVADQKGWLVLSPRARQLVVHTGHAVEEADPELVIDAILDVVDEAR
jgi:hypothetical protein